MYQEKMVAGKLKQVFIKHGREYTRKGYDVPPELAEKFSKKCDFLGETESRMVERLIFGFCMASGWGKETKSGSYFETNSAYHIRDAVEGVKQQFSWVD